MMETLYICFWFGMETLAFFFIAHKAIERLHTFYQKKFRKTAPPNPSA